MYIHTGNHYFCPITHETNINPTLFNYGSNWFNYVDYSGLQNYTNIFNPFYTNNTYGWLDVFGNSGSSAFGFSYNIPISSSSDYSRYIGSGNNISQNLSKPYKSAVNYSVTTPPNDTKPKVAKYLSDSKTKEISKQNKSTKTINKARNDNIKFAKSIAANAESYLGYNEKDGSFRKFSNSTEWCADFVTYVVKESYKKSGKTLPSGFGSWRCETLKQWAINNNKFLRTSDKQNKAEIISQKVKPGDILILRENGASHTGIVKSINKKNGEFTTIEGNVTNKGNDYVAINNYTPYNNEISGFIQLV